jgi:hypothetical protein
MIPAGLVMAVQYAVEIAARVAVDDFAAGQAVPPIALVDAMQGIGWPALGLGVSPLAIGLPELAPRWVVVIGVVGAVSIGLGGILVQALHFVQLGPRFLVGSLFPVWMIWAGIQAARLQSSDRPAAPVEPSSKPASI